ncbi:MAG: hypothetical protein QOF98_2311 [Streptomyces sp.]|nr:hypothetical protein [Streptomyces sp.]
MRVTIARRHFYFHRIEVEQAMNAVVPEPVTGASVDIGGTTYPLMQVGAVITRQDRRDFTSGEVLRAMQALGFPVRTSPSAAPSASSALSESAALSESSAPTND